MKRTKDEQIEDEIPSDPSAPNAFELLLRWGQRKLHKVKDLRAELRRTARELEDVRIARDQYRLRTEQLFAANEAQIVLTCIARSRSNQYEAELCEARDEIAELLAEAIDCARSTEASAAEGQRQIETLTSERDARTASLERIARFVFETAMPDPADSDGPLVQAVQRLRMDRDSMRREAEHRADQAEQRERADVAERARDVARELAAVETRRADEERAAREIDARIARLRAGYERYIARLSDRHNRAKFGARRRFHAIWSAIRATGMDVDATYRAPEDWISRLTAHRDGIEAACAWLRREAEVERERADTVIDCQFCGQEHARRFVCCTRVAEERERRERAEEAVDAHLAQRVESLKAYDEELAQERDAREALQSQLEKAEAERDVAAAEATALQDAFVAMSIEPAPGEDGCDP
jgi:hypothetical protein